MIVDAHHHFWNFNSEEFAWIDESMAVLQRDFLPADLQGEITKTDVDGVVTVQARQTLAETRWLLELAAQHDFIKGVVGWVPLADANVRAHVDSVAENGALCGVRHVVQDEADDDFILGSDFNAGVALLKDYGLAYDILIFQRHLPQTIKFVDRHPDQTFVVDHLAKPLAKENQLEPWRTNIHELARRESVYCKISGLVTEADWQAWTERQLVVYLETVLEAFGPGRLMFGSDWPVCLLATTYVSWYELVERFCARLSADERASIFGRAASKAYRLK